MFGNDWDELLGDELKKPYFKELMIWLDQEYAEHTVYPPREFLFQALKLTSYSDTKVVILGQDPYHGPGQAHGLSFSVLPGIKIPPSLRNIYKELSSDLGVPVPHSGTLTPWAEQGVLLLNNVLTVRTGQAGSHHGRGWETFTTAVIEVLNRRAEPMVFILWGAPAQKKGAIVDKERHEVITSAHPSPLAARRGFFGSRPFSRANDFLSRHGQTPIKWESL
ncbi:uracil-DNA glycosylase [Paenibacillus sp. J22TS3]|uniref:uracil-DNA glycosylase n=1 Tax=Paenibacillus sp. J22TS3 TaxID=2807192 RepID=UPI001B284F20|nr:uracil-DNA glycosylase [Paenibacillus sp. J22TS3]GIP20413.1 uracil-DNA glycosylase [Paenibacillus sp. J22TS3]